jgi:hypothetical protein
LRSPADTRRSRSWSSGRPSSAPEAERFAGTGPTPGLALRCARERP